MSNRSLPLPLTAVVLYAAYEVLGRLSRASTFYFVTTTVANAISNLIEIATILIPAIILYGIVKKKAWGRPLTLAWFTCETLLNIVVLLLAVSIKGILPQHWQVYFDLSCQLLIVIYVHRKNDVFPDEHAPLIQ